MPKFKDVILKFIEKYRSHECLWQFKNEFYYDKTQKTAAWEDLLRLYRTWDPDATMDEVQKKMQNLRSSYTQECRKVMVNENYVPRLWYFKELEFLNKVVKRRSRKYLGQAANKPTSSIIDNDLYEDDEPIGTTEPDTSVSSFASSSSKQLKRAAPKEDVVLEKIPRTETADSKIKHDLYGMHVAEKLRSMEPSMILFCQRMINDAIFQAEIGALNITSRIVTDQIATVPSSSYDVPVYDEEVDTDYEN